MRGTCGDYGSPKPGQGKGKMILGLRCWHPTEEDRREIIWFFKVGNYLKEKKEKKITPGIPHLGTFPT